MGISMAESFQKRARQRRKEQKKREKKFRKEDRPEGAAEGPEELTAEDFFMDADEIERARSGRGPDPEEDSGDSPPPVV